MLKWAPSTVGFLLSEFPKSPDLFFGLYLFCHSSHILCVHIRVAMSQRTAKGTQC